MVQALGAAACVATPDAVSGRWPIIGARAGILAATVAAAGLVNAAQEPEDDDVESELIDDAASPLTTWAILGGVIAALGGLAVIEDRLAARLGRRGVKYPHVLVGAAVGALVFAGSEFEHLRHLEN